LGVTTDSDCGAKQSDIIPMPKLLLAPELALQSTEVGITASFPAFLPHSKSTAPQLLLIPPESKPKPHTNFLTICDRCNSSLTSMNLNRRVSLTPSCSSSSFKKPHLIKVLEPHPSGAHTNPVLGKRSLPFGTLWLQFPFTRSEAHPRYRSNDPVLRRMTHAHYCDSGRFNRLMNLASSLLPTSPCHRNPSSPPKHGHKLPKRLDHLNPSQLCPFVP
jgi:hypothetical protein